VLPLILFEDEHLLVVDKPAGMNTHSPSPFASEGIYEWLKHHEPRWATLAIVHRLDKETSGVMVFGKTTLANRSLTAQFAQRRVRKKYVLLTDKPIPSLPITVQSTLVRIGERYVSHSAKRGEIAETRFSAFPLHVDCRASNATSVQAEPFTGRTHQIRVHAADHGFAILGDAHYGGSPADRVYLHAVELGLRHPATGALVQFRSDPRFSDDARFDLRRALVDTAGTNAFRVVHGASDEWPDLYVDRFDDWLLAQSPRQLNRAEIKKLNSLAVILRSRGVYHKLLNREVRHANSIDASPKNLSGDAAPEEFIIRENEISFGIRFGEGYSVGLFLDQRDNRRRLLSGYIASGFWLSKTEHAPSRDGDQPTSVPLRGRTLLNTFAYTCGFSVCAARAGARVTSLDLSKRYLDWGRRNFELNDLDSTQHDFIYGDVFDWLRRLAKQQRIFDVVVLDPPTFSQSKERGTFRAEKDYGKLVTAALTLLARDGVLFASTNAATFKPEKFLEQIRSAVVSSGRSIAQQHYVPQPPDFPATRSEPGYLKTVWLRVR
jgi:23S rRNA (cytosine1962-C5)-methyltransferase